MWDENYESYSIIENGEIISNICVFKTKLLFNQKQYSALSIGAVATKKECRGRGLSRILMEHIIEKYQDLPMYLSANNGVVNFYPKFGFERTFEKLPVCEFEIKNDIKPVKLQYDDPKVWNYIHKRVNFSHKLDCLNTASINIFHLYWGYLKDSIYEIPELDTLIIAEQKESTLKLIGVYLLRNINFTQLAKFLPFSNVTKVEFGFMPYWSDIEYVMQEYETDPIFIRGINCDLGEFKFPELSIT
ncbi:GNAT family N-acetyltransferase [Geosporobacter ferrireducens]|uniref:GNAT family N-acetyltransferase n=1 Tax=Geosporobacter ferrireducens TaxID=1424294 RepID=UPI00139E0881|nr:GNAT family N-acetyltransferase [Geosporobacter ferrireducens]MTI54803.1 GNAT family N-acetyltransferase [Geosporobacter ferrireducens]